MQTARDRQLTGPHPGTGATLQDKSLGGSFYKQASWDINARLEWATCSSRFSPPLVLSAKCPGGDSRSPRSKLAVPMPAPGFHAERGGGRAPASSEPRAGLRPPRPLTPASSTRDNDGAGSRSERTGDQSGPLGGPLSPVRCSSRPERPHLPPSLKTRSADAGFSFRSLARRSRTAPRGPTRPR